MTRENLLYYVEIFEEFQEIVLVNLYFKGLGEGLSSYELRRILEGGRKPSIEKKSYHHRLFDSLVKDDLISRSPNQDQSVQYFITKKGANTAKRVIKRVQRAIKSYFLFLDENNVDLGPFFDVLKKRMAKSKRIEDLIRADINNILQFLPDKKVIKRLTDSIFKRLESYL